MKRLYKKLVLIFGIVLGLAILSYIIELRFNLNSINTIHSPPTSNSQYKIIYKIYNGDPHLRKDSDYHIINIDGSDDRLLYTKNDDYYPTILGHKYFILQDNRAHKSLLFDGRGEIANSNNFNSSTIFSGGEVFSATLLDRDNVSDQVKIRVYNRKSGELVEYICAECADYSDISIGGFSADTTRLYVFASRDTIKPSMRASIAGYIDLHQNNFVQLSTSGNWNEYVSLFPQYNVAFKINFSSRFDQPSSIDLINLNDRSEKRIVDDYAIGNGLIFNGKDLIYNNFYGKGLDKVRVRGVNVNSGEHYNVLPIELVNTPKDGEKELRDFLPNSSKFIYTIKYDSGWELRIHDLDTKEDRIITNLSSEQFKDSSYYFKSYLGVLFY